MGTRVEIKYDGKRMMPLPQNTIMATNVGVLHNPITRGLDYAWALGEDPDKYTHTYTGWQKNALRREQRARILWLAEHSPDVNVACTCRPDEACHADDLLDLIADPPAWLRQDH